MSPNPRAIIADGQIRRMSESVAGAARESAVGAGAVAAIADGDPMVISQLLVRHGMS